MYKQLLVQFGIFYQTTRGKVILLACSIIILWMLLFSGSNKSSISQISSNNNISEKSSSDDNIECSMKFLIMTVPRFNLKNHVFYLEQTVDSILDLEGEIFKPCIVLLNVKGVKHRPRLEVLRNGRSRIEIVDQVETESVFTSVLLPQKKKQHLNDFYSIMNLVKMKYLNDYVMLMEDDFVFCPNSAYHLSYILTEMEKRQWAGVRVSFGLNGVILQGRDLLAMTEFLKRHSGRATPVDWLLEEFWNQYDLMGENYYNKRKFFTYRLQLMTHIGVVSSVGNARPGSQNDLDFPQCFEAQIHSKLMFSFEMDKCAHSMFSPCENEVKDLGYRAPAPDMIEEHLAPASSNISLSALRSFKAIHCKQGESCTSCCSRNGRRCAKEYFPFINHCKELAKYNPNCKCEREKYILSRAPHTFQGFCFISTRRSRFDCNASKFMQSRLCPCE